MKRLILLLLLSASSPRAEFTLPWTTNDGGGGFCSGGFYSLNGTIAQVEAGPLLSDGTPDGFSLESGYWAYPDVVAAQLPPAIRFDGGFVILTWAETAVPIVLEFSDDLMVWAPVDPQPVGTAWAEPQQDRRFYRLRVQP